VLAQEKDIILTYHFFPSADQTIAQVLQEEIEKHQREEKELMKKREELKKRGIKLDDVEQAPHKIIAPGYNPKETP